MVDWGSVKRKQTFSVSRNDGPNPSKENGKWRKSENFGKTCVREVDGDEIKKPLLVIQYENNKPTLLCDGNVFTKIAPRSAGTNINAPAKPRPKRRVEASVTPSQIVKTMIMAVSDVAKDQEHFALLSTTPSTHPSKVVWIGVNPNWLTISCLWLVSYGSC